MDFKTFKGKYLNVEVEEVPNLVNKKPLLSVIVLSYQHADFIEECLKKILNQKTNFFYEIIIGEDASTDGTTSIVLKYAKNNPYKIRLFLWLFRSDRATDFGSNSATLKDTAII